MIIHYFDPSAWVKRHFQEIGTDVVNTLFRTTQGAACCRLGYVEMVATIARKGHGEALDSRTLQGIFDNVRDDFAKFRVPPIDEPRIRDAEELAVRHRMRTMDAIHLASALSLRAWGVVVMVSSDTELLAAAANEGLTSINPNSTATVSGTP